MISFTVVKVKGGKMLRIVVDSTSSLSAEEAKKYNVDIVPLYLFIDGMTYKDRVDISINLFYKLLKIHQPTTSQPTPNDFLNVFNKYPDDEIICITMSNKMSGTYQSANIAKDMCENKNIAIVNSTNASVGVINLVFKAMQMREENKSLEEVVEEIEKLKKRLLTIGMCDTMENLRRSGRISHTKFIAGSLLGIKPILIFQEGMLQPYHKKARGKKKAINMMIEALKEFDYDPNYPLLIAYSRNIENAVLLAEKLKENGVNVDNSHFFELGTVVGTHTGENTFIMNFISKRDVE